MEDKKPKAIGGIVKTSLPYMMSEAGSTIFIPHGMVIPVPSCCEISTSSEPIGNQIHISGIVTFDGVMDIQKMYDELLKNH